MVVRPAYWFGTTTGFGVAIKQTLCDVNGSAEIFPVTSVTPITEIVASSFEYSRPPKSRNSYLIPALIQRTSADSFMACWKSGAPSSFAGSGDDQQRQCASRRTARIAARAG